MPIELQTEDKLEYTFFPNSSGLLQFRVRAPNDAHIALSPSASEATPMYEVFIGGWGNSKSVIRKNRSKPDVAEASTPGYLNPDEYRGFWIRWEGNTLSAGCEGSAQPFLRFDDHEHVPIEYIGICTGWGATGAWIIEEPRQGYSGGGGYGGGYGGGSFSNQCWVAARNGEVPPSAFAGGEDNGEPVYVARASFNGGLIPGKLVASHGTCYVPWGGAENAVPEYEVLCDFRGSWVACSGANIPPNAVTAGQSETGEPLYVGRAVHDGSLTVGKVQPSHGVVYIAYGGSELGFPDYEILVQ